MALITAAVMVIAAAPPRTRGPSPTYANPILPVNFPDPSVLRVGDTLFAYATGQVKRRSSRYVQMSTTTDLRHWSLPKGVLALPVWASGEVWAPHTIRDPHNPGRYVMYFSARARSDAPGVPKDSKMCLGVAVAAHPEGPFIAADRPLDKDACRRGDGDIDPYVWVDDLPGEAGKLFLYWGSARKPIRQQQISDDLLSLVPGTKRDILSPTITPAGRRPQYSDLVEGAWLLHRGSYYYLFTSGYHCCLRDDDTYAVVVWRSKTLVGPWTRFPDGPGGAILHANAKWGSPGHNATFTDGAGHDWILYHARRPGQSRRVLLMDRLDWSTGWPRVVTDAAPQTPSIGPMSAPVPYRPSL